MKIYTAQDQRAMDAMASQNGVPTLDLMQNAGNALAQIVIEEWIQNQHIQHVCVLAGKGNNGGDAFVMLQSLPCSYDCFVTHPKQECSQDAQAFFPSNALPLETLDLSKLPPHTLIIDALFGTGFKGELPANILQIIPKIEELKIPVLAVDIPSGLDAETGKTNGAFTAEMTVSFVALKPGHLLENGPQYCGKLRVVDIGMPPCVLDAFKPLYYEVTTQQTCKNLIPTPSRYSHKTQFGKVIVVGGLDCYSGSVALSSTAAMKSGAGMCTVVTAENNVGHFLNAVIQRRLPLDKKGKAIFDVDRLLTLKDWGDVSVIGPGLTVTPEGANLFRYFLSSAFGSRKFVVDADALTLMANLKLAHHSDLEIVITPHAGEAARLAEAYHVAPLENQNDTKARMTFAQNLAQALHCTVVLKGLRTMIVSADGTQVAVNTSGTPALATAGSGDVLSGIIAGWMARGLSPFDAARIGVFIHGKLTEKYPFDVRGITADDLLNLIPQV